MLKKILMAVLVLLAVFIGAAMMQPDEFSISSSRVISASTQTLFPHVNSFRKMNEWSPWAKMDPNAKNTFSGPEEGVGAKFAWAGNENIGEGNMEITESRPYELVKMRLEFLKPFAAVNTTLFTFQPEVAGKTRVTWTMSGKRDFTQKAIGMVMQLFFDCNKMISDQFEKGLASLAIITEKKASAASAVKE